MIHKFNQLLFFFREMVLAERKVLYLLQDDESFDLLVVMRL